MEDGRTIAGTGAIDVKGNVQPIGGIPFKLIAAKEDGATTFLVPADNCAEAKADAPDGLQLVKVETLAGAVEALEGPGRRPHPAALLGRVSTVLTSLDVSSEVVVGVFVDQIEEVSGRSIIDQDDQDTGDLVASVVVAWRPGDSWLVRRWRRAGVRQSFWPGYRPAPTPPG